MRVLFIATELGPWVKVGGLGDFVGSLPKALRARGVDARVVIPAHAGVLRRAPSPTTIASFPIEHASGSMRAEILQSELEGVPVYLVSGPPIAPESIVYTGRMDEEGRRFTFFSIAALELCRHLAPKPDIVHCHDWHTAVVPWMLRARRTDADFASIASLLTVHNLPYTGLGAEAELRGFGIAGASDDRVPEELRGAPMALGLVAADRISTVSVGYAREILTPELGAGFDALLRARRAELHGIPNGLDLASWNPATDPALDAPGDPSNRAINRAVLRQELGLPSDADAPIVAFVGRMVSQKGVDLVLGALRILREERWQAVFLGTGEPWLESAVLSLAAEESGRVRARIGFDERLARRIYAGADLLLVPSRYEPCGMTQLIAMRYGAIPVARETGGLADTVRDLDLADAPTGVLFPEASAPSLAFAIRRALAGRRRPAKWAALIATAMAEDSSWERSAAAYAELYEAMVEERRGEAEAARPVTEVDEASDMASGEGA